MRNEILDDGIMQVIEWRKELEKKDELKNKDLA